MGSIGQKDGGCIILLLGQLCLLRQSKRQRSTKVARVQSQYQADHEIRQGMQINSAAGSGPIRLFVFGDEWEKGVKIN